MKKLHKIGIRLARPDILFFCLPWLMVLLVVGTVAQRDLGLFRAEQLFFSSWVFWWGPLPLPGGALTLTLIFINLCAKFIFKSTWSWYKSGVILTHFGILLLFIGAIFTATTAEEGYMTIPEGWEKSVIQDYHKKGFYIFKNEQLIASYEISDLVEGQHIVLPDTPVSLHIRNVCQNCSFAPTPENQKAGKHGLAEKITLTARPLNPQNEANMAGITFDVKGAEEDENGFYASTEAAPHAIHISVKEDDYRLQVQREERPLPFTIRLIDFQRDFHPGTMMAKAYRSDIEVLDGEAHWPAHISMNHPLRYKGYTFFQSSFAQTPAGEATILAVVKNTGWLFPYIASIVIACGLLLHLAIRKGRSKYE
ncbi:MAG: cytochrome c biogenesis protein ResB [Rhodospirillales bacterium]|nr:cytochrome c biogenesis protein ResB [Rhodospirillales bacterium]MCB9973271.1 cytochrome c biogenesis protein ResB [Rhodospirillales bacterium]